MSLPSRLIPRLRPLRAARSTSARFYAVSTIQSQTPPAPIEASQKQAMPIGSFYEAILDDPHALPATKPEEPPTTSASKKKEPATSAKKSLTEQVEPPAPSPPPQTAAEKAAIVFGSALAGPKSRAERLAAMRPKATVIAGVSVPARPEEPDNCCMSGCVNCVWDTYREEMEEWSTANAEAQTRLLEQEAGRDSLPMGGDGDDEHAGVSMSDDGGGSETNWATETRNNKKNGAKDLWDEKLYADIPVGIREFMKTEKRLKTLHEREGTTGG